MAGIAYEILDVLEQQKECYEGLLVLSNYKSRAIIEKDIEFLKEVTSKEEEFLGRVNLLDKKRERLFKDISQVTGLNYNEMTLSKIIDKMGPDLEISQDLLLIKKDLTKVIEQVKRRNEQNRVLLNESLEYVEFTLNAIQTTKLSGIEVNYSKPGQQSETESKRTFDTRS